VGEARIEPRESADGVAGAGMKSLPLLALLASVIYLGQAVFMGVLPGYALSAVPASPGLRPLTAEQAAGRDAYVGEGCSYCHTQFVRPLAQDLVWGRPSAPGDYTNRTPELFGTERNGPDLTNVGMRQPSDVWNEIHLYEPRALVAGSIMPSYRYLFVLRPKALPGDVVVPVPPGFAPPGEVVVAGPEVLALTAYIESLQQPALSSKP
jgi:cytochrome c oxidase cbb3-type subunit 2